MLTAILRQDPETIKAHRVRAAAELKNKAIQTADKPFIGWLGNIELRNF